MASTHKSLKKNGIFINNQTITRPKKTKVFDPPGGLRRKIKTVKWLTKKLMEYDIENDYWTPVEVKCDKIYYAFSRAVYLPNQDMMVMGGLDDSIPDKPTFSERTILIQEVPINSYDNSYI
jgi:hypothetical protein